MTRRALLAASFATVPSAAHSAQPFDLVFAGGRIIDPETRLDAVRHVGIAGGTIRAVSAVPLRGRVTIEARGLVVAPGFIDLHAHGQDLENNRLQAQDGVTTALELEGGTDNLPHWYAERRDARMLNYGASIGHNAVRKLVMPNGDEAERRAATDDELKQIRALIEQGLRRGALSVGMGLEYAPVISRWEVLEVFRAAAAFGATVFVHTRYGAVTEPGSALEGVQEVIAASASTGAPVHVVHVSSMGLRTTPQLLQVIGEAQARGVEVTTECYPYTAFATGIASAVFDPGWQERFGLSYGDLQWAATGERLTAETFMRYQKQGGTVIAHAIPEEIVTATVANPLTSICSDGQLRQGKGHPRGSGSFARVLGHFVRERNALSLTDAIRKMTLMPARRLERRAPAMKRKGRVQVGCDADLTVFDPRRVIDRATYAEPARPSEGMAHVLVHGQFVVRDGKLVEAALVGRPVRVV